MRDSLFVIAVLYAYACVYLMQFERDAIGINTNENTEIIKFNFMYNCRRKSIGHHVCLSYFAIS